MEFSPETEMEWTPDLDDKPKFNAVIIYEDRPAGRRAKDFYNKLIHDFEDECDFSLELWNFHVLAIPEFGESAAESRSPSRLCHSFIARQSWTS